jgi:hypothetical protein
MRLRVGDKVRFLNEAIEGTVSAVLSNDRVEIITAEGFSQIASEQHLVKVEFNMEEKFILEKEEPETNAADKPIKQVDPKVKASSRLPVIPSLKLDETIYAAITLKDEHSPLTSDIDLSLINNCSYSIAFTVSKRKEDLRSAVAAGIMNERTEQFIGTFSQDELHRFNGFMVDMLFFNERDFIPRPPVEKHLIFSSTDFVNHEYWETLKGREDEVLLLPVFVINQERDINVKKLLERYRQKDEDAAGDGASSSRNAKGKLKAQKFVLFAKEKVVDLHIEELVKDYSEMNNAQIISYQLNFFLYEMDQAVLNKLHKITFIHGVGQGVLKSAIKEELKKFPNIRFGEAPAEKYGYGATEVEFV